LIPNLENEKEKIAAIIQQNIEKSKKALDIQNVQQKYIAKEEEKI
jgi:hypothetical protein